MSNKLVSVIIPIYNVEDYIQKCVISVVQQSYSNIEIICVNDGSEDNSISKLREIEDSRIIIINKKNGGLSDARNYGIDNCNGEYIYLLDADDYIDKECIEKMVYEMNNNNADIVMSDYKMITENDEPFSIIRKKRLQNIVESGPGIYERYFGYTVLNTAWGKLYKKDCFIDVRYPVGKLHEDEYVTYKLICSANKVVSINDEFYYYRLRNNSIMNVKWTEKNLEVIEAFDEKIKYMRKEGFDVLWMKSIQNELDWLISFRSGNIDAELYDLSNNYLKERYILYKNELKYIARLYYKLVIDIPKVAVLIRFVRSLL